MDGIKGVLKNTDSDVGRGHCRETDDRENVIKHSLK